MHDLLVLFFDFSKFVICISYFLQTTLHDNSGSAVPRQELSVAAAVDNAQGREKNSASLGGNELRATRHRSC